MSSTFAVKKFHSADDTRNVSRTLAVCPTCAWPILPEVGQCVRCHPFVSPESTDEATPTIDDAIGRNVTGQMPSMAIFSETQQVSAAERQAELAWQQAQFSVAQRRTHAPSDRLPIVIAVLVVGAVIAAFFVVRGGGNDEPSLTTPANDLPWRSVAIEGGSWVELPGVPVTSSTTSEIGGGTRITTTVPGATIALSMYRPDYGMRGAGATAADLLKGRAADLGDMNAGGRIKQNRDRWGDAYDLSVVTNEPIARLRAIVVGPRLFLIEVVGPQTTRTTQIFSRVVNTLVPKT